MSTYPDVAEAKCNPIAHYVRHGAKEHRNSTSWFNTAYYLNTYPDVATSGINHFTIICVLAAKKDEKHNETCR